MKEFLGPGKKQNEKKEGGNGVVWIWYYKGNTLWAREGNKWASDQIKIWTYVIDSVSNTKTTEI